ncbi:MAG: hypothetical protein EXR59_00095 [Dehalococcoidia bacterium]|nr:hypothetical protein [Dehalococcoidia bacterium]
MIKSFFVAILVLFTLAAVACTTEAKAEFGEWVEIPYGHDVSISNGPQIKFLEFDESRCAIGVTCVWAGEAKAYIIFKDSDKATTHTLTDGASDDKTEKIRGYKVNFSVNPYPKAGRAVPKKDYVLKVRVHKDALVSSDMTPTLTTTVPGTPKPTATTFPTTRVKAPIDKAEIAIAKSLPPQYSVVITSGLPSGCAKFYSYDVKRDGEIITISVWNTIPSVNMACTTIYGYVDTSVQLGSDFEKGKTYTVMINDEKRTFVVQ